MPDQDKHFFLTILLTDKYLQSSLVSNNGQGVQIQEFSKIANYFDRQDLSDQLDKSLQQLGEDSNEVSETVFAFDQTWLENGELSADKKAVIKDVSEKLSLDAVGQFSIPEALAEARLIGDENDSCLLMIFKENIFDLVFLKHGQFIDLITVGRSGDVVADFSEILARAAKHLDQDDGKYFPSKILLTSIALSKKELDSLHSQLAKVDWTTNPGFTQAPDIVALEADYMIKSVSLSAGKIFSKESLLAKMPKKQPIATTPHQQIEQKPLVSNIKKVEEASEENDYAIEKPSASSFGIKFDQNYHKNNNESSDNKVSSEDIAAPVAKPTKKRSPFGRFYLYHQKMILLGFGAGLLALILAFTAFALLFSKVRIVITPEETLLHKNVTITLDPNIETSDFEEALLKASVQNKEISGQDVLATTGIGLVGDKAKGRVIIYNKTSQEVELKQGTIVSTNDIEFLLDETIKVPASVVKQDGSGVDFGKFETNVTAKDIGSEANFNKDTKFRVADYFEDKFSAISADNFSGGSSREVRVVAQIDQDRLMENLTKKLSQEAAKEYETDSKDGVYLVPTGKVKVNKSEFSAKIGDETESITLSLTVNVEAVKYLSKDLKSLGLALLEKDLPAGYVFMDEDPSLMSDKAQAASDSSKIKLTADLSAKAVAKIDLNSLKPQILGKPWIGAEESLENSAEIRQAQVIFNPPFLINVLRNLPNDQNRVILELNK